MFWRRKVNFYLKSVVLILFSCLVVVLNSCCVVSVLVAWKPKQNHQQFNCLAEIQHLSIKCFFFSIHNIQHSAKLSAKLYKPYCDVTKDVHFMLTLRPGVSQVDKKCCWFFFIRSCQFRVSFFAKVNENQRFLRFFGQRCRFSSRHWVLDPFWVTKWCFLESPTNYFQNLLYSTGAYHFVARISSPFISPTNGHKYVLNGNEEVTTIAFT